MQACSRSDPNRNECVRSSIENFLLGLEKNPTYYSDLQFEPLLYGPITFKYDYENFIKGWFRFEDCKCYGLQDAKVLKVKSYFTDKEIKIHALLKHPRLFATGNYAGSGELSPIKYANHGSFNVTILDVTAKWTVRGTIVNRNGEEFLNIDYFDINPDAKGMKFEVSGSNSNDALCE